MIHLCYYVNSTLKKKSWDTLLISALRMFQHLLKNYEVKPSDLGFLLELSNFIAFPTSSLVKTALREAACC